MPPPPVVMPFRDHRKWYSRAFEVAAYRTIVGFEKKRAPAHGAEWQMAEPKHMLVLPMSIHDPSACEGRACCIHHPSDHHMKDWPQVWRADRYLMERTCPHGIGHPDPDHVAYMLSVGKWQDSDGVHGCDGCCNGTLEAELK